MGVEYAIVHDESNEAFDLDKGPWADWKGEPLPHMAWKNYRGNGIPTSREAVAETFRRWVTATGWSPTLSESVEQLVDRVWNFIESHRGCYVIDDCGSDDWWTENPPVEGDERFDPSVRCYKQIGSRYE